METRKFVCVVDGIPASGTVTGRYREISDYKDEFKMGEPDCELNFEFTMIMVSTPPLYVVNRVTALIGFSQLHTPVTGVRQTAEVCFESTLRFIVEAHSGALGTTTEVQAAEEELQKYRKTPTDVPEALRLALGINNTYQT